MAIEEQINQALDLLVQSRWAIGFTGAGISTPSGIPDFRSPGTGLWQDVDPLEVASIYTFKRRPQDFYNWIGPVANRMLQAQPNVAHYALADLEQNGVLKSIITQNVDMLHSRAGSETIYELHGHLREATCLSCYSEFPSTSFLKNFVERCEIPYCELCGGVLKPNVILFGEQLPVHILNEAKRQAARCDLMLVIGSSLEVAPSGDLPLLAVESGSRMIIVNNEATPMDQQADVVIRADVVDVLPKLASLFLNG